LRKCLRGGFDMKTWLFCLALIALVPFTARASGDLVTFTGGIGVDPVQGTKGTDPNITVVKNVVRGVNPPGAPWRIADLFADIGTDGSIVAIGRGLLLAGTDGIGTNPVKEVLAKLFCGPAASATASESATVPLDTEGDFKITGTLSPTPSSSCATPVLLIVVATRSGAAPGPWLAAGILEQPQP
jgi:hypothetical protein